MNSFTQHSKVFSQSSRRSVRSSAHQPMAHHRPETNPYRFGQINQSLMSHSNVNMTPNMSFGEGLSHQDPNGSIYMHPSQQRYPQGQPYIHHTNTIQTYYNHPPPAAYPLNVKIPPQPQIFHPVPPHNVPCPQQNVRFNHEDPSRQRSKENLHVNPSDSNSQVNVQAQSSEKSAIKHNIISDSE